MRNWIINWLCNLKLSLGTYVCIYEKRMLNASSLETSVQDREMIELYYLIFSLWGNSRFFKFFFFNRTGTLCIIKILSPSIHPWQVEIKNLRGKCSHYNNQLSFLSSTFSHAPTTQFTSSYCLCFLFICFNFPLLSFE